MLPQTAGIYIWTTQLARLWDDPVLGADTLLNSVGAVLQRVREMRYEQARVGSYRRVHIYDDPVSLTPASIERLSALLGSKPEELPWVLMCATLFQRPLYVGKTINFQNRIRDHFDHRTKFSKALRASGIATTECSVALCPVTIENIYEGPTYDERADEEILSVDTASLEETDEAVADDVDEEAVPPDRKELDRLIRLAESLVIRTAHPIFNEKMD